MLDDPNTIADSLQLYHGGFSATARDVIDKFDFGIQIDRLRKVNLLYKVIGKFAEIDLHPDAVSNIEMGYLYKKFLQTIITRVDANEEIFKRTSMTRTSAPRWESSPSERSTSGCRSPPSEPTSPTTS